MIDTDPAGAAEDVWPKTAEEPNAWVVVEELVDEVLTVAVPNKLLLLKQKQCMKPTLD